MSRGREEGKEDMKIVVFVCNFIFYFYSLFFLFLIWMNEQTTEAIKTFSVQKSFLPRKYNTYPPSHKLPHIASR